MLHELINVSRGEKHRELVLGGVMHQLSSVMVSELDHVWWLDEPERGHCSELDDGTWGEKEE